MTTETKPGVHSPSLTIRTRPAILLSLAIAAIAVAILAVRALSWSAGGLIGGPSEIAPLANDVSILSLDFDPPLGSPVAAGRQRALLVVVDNRGTEPQAKLRVDTEVIDTSTGLCLKTISEPLSALTPGEVKVLRFEQIGLSAGSNLPATVNLTATIWTENGESFADGTRSLPVTWANVQKVD